MLQQQIKLNEDGLALAKCLSSTAFLATTTRASPMHQRLSLLGLPVELQQRILEYVRWH